MTILCPCGGRLKDGTDDIPYKGWLIPDQERIDAEHDIDRKAIDPVAAGELDRHTAHMTWRVPFYQRVRSVYQCNACGRVGIADKNGKLHWYAPDEPESSKDILRSRGGEG
jgi:hypothetical protein